MAKTSKATKFKCLEYRDFKTGANLENLSHSYDYSGNIPYKDLKSIDWIMKSYSRQLLAMKPS